MFLSLVKESLELKRSRVTFFRKARKHYKGKSEFLKEARRDEIERTDLGYKVFKLIRGTAPYLQDKRNSVMAMIRQLGPPHLFITLSSAEMEWDEVHKAILELELKRPVSQEEIDALSKKQRRENISKNPFIVAHHFHKRIGKVFNFLKTSTGGKGILVKAV